MTKPTSDAYGLWHVTTEGDCEGRTTKDLGTHEGYLDDIAFALGNAACYQLQFERVDPQAIDQRPSCNEVHVSLPIKSKTWDMKPADRANYYRCLLSERNVSVSESNFYAAVKLTRSTEDRIHLRQKELRASALAKLTDDEARALGLK